jgi:N-acetylmuramoyl-L-alanine amidase
MKTIMIDAGHGGKDSGAVGPNGLRESDVALSVALLLGSLLIGDFKVLYTRKTDVFIELGARARAANDGQADAFISIHCNSGPVGQGKGFEVYTTPGETASDKLATDVFLAWAETFPLSVKRMDISDGDPDKEANFTVIKRTNMRAVLFELDFIHTHPGEQLLGATAFQVKAAKALATGLKKHFGITSASTFPEVVPIPAGVDLPAKIRGIVAELQTLTAQL